MDPTFLAISTGLKVFGAMQAGRAEKRRQAAIAAQQEQNAKFEKLRALQDHNARIAAFSAYESTANAARAINRRSTSDRSYQAIMKASRERSRDDLDRVRVQSLLTQSRMAFAAADARASGSLAMQQALLSAGSDVAMSGYKMQQVTPTGTD